jgi:hypothetical protein
VISHCRPPEATGVADSHGSGPQGPSTEGLSAEGLSAEGLGAEGLSAEGLGAEGLGAEGCPAGRSAWHAALRRRTHCFPRRAAGKLRFPRPARDLADTGNRHDELP